MGKLIEGLTRQERRAMIRDQHQMIRALPKELTKIPPSEWGDYFPHMPISVWRSRRYLVQIYTEDNRLFPGLIRLSVCRAIMRSDGQWEDGITWDELQEIKRIVGYGDNQGIEIYPPDSDVINVANFRHLWILEIPLPIGWYRVDSK